MKPGRNEPCPCGSGKKYKKCCHDKFDAAPVFQTDQQPDKNFESKRTANSEELKPSEISQLVSLFNEGRYVEVENRTHLLLEQYPNSGFAWKVMGATLQSLGKDALPALQKATEFLPDDAEAYNNLGIALRDIGRFDDSVACYQRALMIKSNFAEAYNNLGVVLQDLRRLNDAVANCRQALKIKPDFAGAYLNLGNALQELGQLEEAVTSYRQALKIKPDYTEVYCNLGAALKNMGELLDAKACYRTAQKLGSNGAWVSEALMLPAIMGTRQDIMQSRADFERNLDQLIEKAVPLNDPLQDVRETNFYLAFHGLNDRDLQVKVAKYYEQACPSLLHIAPHCIKSKTEPQKKIRIGFLSKFLYNHSVSLCLSKIIEGLSLKAQFETILISNQSIDEKIYSDFVGQRVCLPNNLVLAREILAALELDILLYLDIGMDPLSYFLAFSRLAKVQCVLGGHPVTTGITNMDYFLSSGWMESSDADEHYSEKLVILSRPISYFSRPALPALLKSRSELGLPDDQHIYLCPMKLQKIHPDFDEAIFRILQIDANGVVVLIEDDKFSSWKTALVKRFKKTIPLEVQERILFLPWLKTPTDFISAVASADVILDSFHFGIGSTAMITFATGTPFVTRTGEFMRGRVGTGYCLMADLQECIAEDTETYAQKAVQIASNQILRDTIRAKILKNSHVMYENLQPVENLTDFFCSLTNSL
jgi:protein O-GlcNAc transferase